ncbi:MAG: peroxiredoxin [Neomegalonema sp.]
MVNVGDKLPEMEVALATADGPDMQSLSTLFGSGKSVLFAVPGAFTPTCHMNHLPGFLTHLDAIKSKGVSRVACLSVNDPFVMKAWGEATGAMGKIDLIADGSAAATQARGQVLDLTERGLGVRSQRYAMIIEDGVVKDIAVEDSPATADASGAEALMAKL